MKMLTVALRCRTEVHETTERSFFFFAGRTALVRAEPTDRVDRMIYRILATTPGFHAAT